MEPGEWSWDDQSSSASITNWDCVKNKQAQNNLKSMTLNDLCFFYHSGATARRVVGVFRSLEWYHSEDGGGDGMVDLKEMKGDDGLLGFSLFRQLRLFVVAVPEQFWRRICELGGGYETPAEENRNELWQ